MQLAAPLSCLQCTLGFGLVMRRTIGLRPVLGKWLHKFIGWFLFGYPHLISAVKGTKGQIIIHVHTYTWVYVCVYIPRHPHRHGKPCPTCVIQMVIITNTDDDDDNLLIIIHLVIIFIITIKMLSRLVVGELHSEGWWCLLSHSGIWQFSDHSGAERVQVAWVQQGGERTIVNGHLHS